MRCLTDYARRARDASDYKEVGDNVKRAIDELITEIKNLKVRVSNLEAEHR